MNAFWTKRLDEPAVVLADSDCFHIGMTVPGTPSLMRQKTKLDGRFLYSRLRRSAGRALLIIAYGPSPLPAQPWHVRHFSA